MDGVVKSLFPTFLYISFYLFAWKVAIFSFIATNYSMATIAILGASSDRNKFGNRCVRTYLQKGYTVYPIHPRETIIEGLPVYASIQDVPPESIDIVSIYLQPEIALGYCQKLPRKKFQKSGSIQEWIPLKSSKWLMLLV
jgi:predicted CoA-binding protein